MKEERNIRQIAVLLLALFLIFSSQAVTFAEDVSGATLNETESEQVEAQGSANETEPDEDRTDVRDTVVPEITETEQTGIAYRVHVQTHGWESEWTSNGGQSGTTGQKKRLEAIQIQLTNPTYAGGIRYKTHIQTYGWEPDWVENGEVSGTSGQAKRLEAIQIELTGEIAQHYDIYYRVHAQTYGWLGWAKNGENAGSSGQAKRLEAIEIRLVEKDAPAPGDTSGAYKHPLVQYETHVQTYGWQAPKYDGATSGTTGQAKRLEGIRISLNEQDYEGSILYCTHVQTYGWEKDWVADGEISGTSGQAKRLEAIKIKLDGEIANLYDVYYRVHAQTFGWLDWAKNGEPSGTEGLAKRLEGIEIRLVEKGGNAPGSTRNPFIDRTDKIVVIDPGHQTRANLGREAIGPGASETKMKVTGGTAGVTTGIAEYQVALDVSMKLQRELKNRGYVVVMVRTSNDVNISNQERAQVANNLGADAFVRIHCNGSDNRSVNGAATICMTENSPYCRHLYRDSRRLSELILTHMCQATGARRKMLMETNTMTGINWSKVPVTIVEMGYLTNPAEERKLISADYQEKLANGIANGISAYLDEK